MKNALFTCSVYKDIFRSRTDLKNHVRRDHQGSVKVKFRNGNVKEIKRGNDNAFKCSCGKSFKLPYSLQKHTKECNDGLASIDGRLTAEDISGEEDDSDASELSESASNRMDDTPTDCIGNTASQNWLIVEDDDLRKINCMINERMKLIICRRQ